MTRTSAFNASQVADPTQRLLGLKILLVEDSEVSQLVAAELLASEGAEVLIAENGITAVEIATDDSQRLDAILMDMQLPDIDGPEATKRILMHSSSKDIPIVAMTGSISPEDRAACLEAGMIGYIAKPFDMDNLVHLLTSLITTCAVDEDIKTIRTAQNNVDAEIEAWQSILKRFNNSSSVYSMALEKFPEENGRLQAELQKHICTNDGKALAATLHAMGGIAGLVGAIRLRKMLTGYEMRIRAGEAVSTFLYHETLEQIAELTDRSLSALKIQLIAHPGSEQMPLNACKNIIPPNQWLLLLREILPLMESGNMRALERISELQNSAPEQFVQYAQQLQALLDQLQFKTATEITRDLLSKGILK